MERFRRGEGGKLTGIAAPAWMNPDRLRLQGPHSKGSNKADRSPFLPHYILTMLQVMPAQVPPNTHRKADVLGFCR